MSGPDFTQQAHDLLQQMSAIVDSLILAVEESRFDDLDRLLGQRDVCPEALEQLAQAQPLCQSRFLILLSKFRRRTAAWRPSSNRTTPKP